MALSFQSKQEASIMELEICKNEIRNTLIHLKEWMEPDHVSLSIL